MSLASVLSLTAFAAPGPTEASELKSIQPAVQRVHDFVVLRGKGFGKYLPGVSRVHFIARSVGPGPASELDVYDAGTPYVWRDDFIQVRVPAGRLEDGTPKPIPLGQLLVRVINSDGQHSKAIPFRVASAPAGASLAFEQLTDLVNDVDVSAVLGSPNLNLARTKDAEVGDVNGDGYPDLVDNNSNNVGNDTHGVLRLNTRQGAWTAIALEPTDAADLGFFATVIPPGGTYIGNSVTYDSDLVDLTGDGFPELVQALTGAQPLRVLRNTSRQALPPRFFVDDTVAWLGGQSFPGSPDDLAHADLDGNGFVDVGVALRGAESGSVLLNGAGITFRTEIPIPLPDAIPADSVHDLFFLDADADGSIDVFLVNEGEERPSRLLFNDGGDTPGFLPGPAFSLGDYTLSGASGDFNADGLADFGLLALGDDVAGSAAGGGGVEASVFLNDPAAPGTFQHVILSSPGPGTPYDLELGDLDLDGDVDLVAAILQTGNIVGANSAAVWLNDGSGGFTRIPAAGLLPDLAPYQRLSADLLDFDLDGDLDLYLTGADGQNIGFGFGAVANQLWENRLITRPVASLP